MSLTTKSEEILRLETEKSNIALYSSLAQHHGWIKFKEEELLRIRGECIEALILKKDIGYCKSEDLRGFIICLGFILNFINGKILRTKEINQEIDTIRKD
jgi:hypothetical protein